MQKSIYTILILAININLTFDVATSYRRLIGVEIFLATPQQLRRTCYLVSNFLAILSLKLTSSISNLGLREKIELLIKKRVSSQTSSFKLNRIARAEVFYEIIKLNHTL